MCTVPPEEDSRPATMRKSVVLPQPDGPSRTQNSPSATPKEISSKIRVAPNVLDSLVIVREAMTSSHFVDGCKPLTFHRSRRQALHDAPLKDQGQRNQRQRCNRSTSRDPAPGLGVITQ